MFFKTVLFIVLELCRISCENIWMHYLPSGMWAVKICSHKRLQFLIGGVGKHHSGHKTCYSNGAVQNGYQTMSLTGIPGGLVAPFLPSPVLNFCVLLGHTHKTSASSLISTDHVQYDEYLCFHCCTTFNQCHLFVQLFQTIRVCVS